MPLVPKTRQVQVSPDQTPYQTDAGASEAAFGGRSARALQGLGGAVTQVGDVTAAITQDIQRTRNDTDFNEGRVNYDAGANSLLYGDGSTENPGFFSLKGKAAIEAAPAIAEKLKQLRKDTIANYNPAVQKRLEASLGLRENELSKSVATHNVEQRRVYDNTLSEARVQGYIDNAAVGYQSEEVILQSQAGMELVVHDMARRNGWDPEITNAKLKTGRTALYKSTIESAIKRNDITTAKALFAKYGDRMEGPVAADVQAQLLKASDEKEAQDLVDRIMSDPAYASDQDRYAAIKDLANTPEIRKAAENRFTQEAARKKAFNDQQAELIEQEFSQALNDPNNQQRISDLQRLFPDKYAVLSKDTKAMARLRATEKAAMEGRLFAPASDGATLLEIRGMDSYTLGTMSDAKLQTYRASLTAEEWAQAVALHDGAKDTLIKNSQGYEAYIQGRKIIADLAPAGFGFGVTKPTQEQVARMNDVTNQMYAFIRSYTKVGKKPTYGEMVDEANRLLLPIERSSSFSWMSAKERKVISQLRYADPELRESYRIDLDSVMPSRIQEVRDVFAQYGQPPPTDEQISEFLTADAFRDSRKQLNMLERGYGFEISSDPAFQPAREARNTRINFNQEATAGGTLFDFIRRSEGYRETVYTDTMGNATIGIGFNLDRKGAQFDIESVGADYTKVLAGTEKLTERQINLLTSRDIVRSSNAAEQLVPNFVSLSQNRQRAIIDMIYNMGAEEFANFKTTIKAIESGDFEAAAKSILSSKYAKDVPNRAKRNAELIRKG